MNHPTSHWVARCGPERNFKVRTRCWSAGPRAVRRWDSECLPFASLRVPCDARSSGPLHNSLRSLRSLWSDICSESVDEAREYARGQKPCASRRRTVAPAPHRPRASQQWAWACTEKNHPRRQGCGPASAGVSMRRRGAEFWGRRAYSRASSSDSQHRFDHSERSEQRALCSATPERAPQRTPRSGASNPIPGAGRRAALHPHSPWRRSNCGRWRTAATGRKRASAARRLMHRGSREARWSN